MWTPASTLRRARSPRASARGDARRRPSALWATLAAGWQRNGIWAPGILLLRNLSLRAKAEILSAVFICALVVLLAPQILRARADLGAIDRSEVALHATEAAVALEQALQQGARAGAAAPAAAASAADGTAPAFDRLQASLHDGGDWAAPAALKVVWDEVLQRRQAAASTELARRPQAATDLLAAVRSLRSGLTAAWLPQIGRFGPSDLSGIDPRDTLDAADLLHRLVVAATPLLQPGAADSSAVLDLALNTRAHLSVADPHLDQLVRQAALDRTSVTTARREAQAFVESAADLARHPAQWAANPVGDSGSPAAAFQRAGDNAATALGRVNTQLLAAMATELRASRADTASHVRWLALASGAAVLLCFYLVVSTFMVLAGGVRALRQHCANLAKGDLSGRPRGWGRDEIGESLTHLGTATGHMAQLLGAMTQGVSAVSHASREVATGNAGLSGHTGDIRKAVGEVRERTEGLSQSMEASASGVGEAAQHVSTMRLNAQRSRKAVITLRGHMRSLRNKSREVTHVVSLVESVAHQTKLLSLNASVEAARAGAAGKAFSIVAQEVRALALSTEDAARRIQTIIGSSVDEIQEGNLVADRAGDAVEAADASIEAVHTLMNDVVSLTGGAMKEAQEVLGITRTVEEAISGNSRTVDQLQRASSALREQGDSLKLSVQHFILS